MRRSIARWWQIIFLLGLLLTTSALTGATTHQRLSSDNSANFPIVDPHYIYDQLYTMVTRFQAREAGYDGPGPNGHKGFADYWSQEMLKNLNGFGAVATHYDFPLTGWSGRPATSPATNVEVSVPGSVHPEQVVVIGCHYDGEAISTQSANDDGSGCAIELGVAKALGTYWRQHQIYPDRTLRFVLFDAEEQGLYGSYDYVNRTTNGDLNNIVAMFNEEQNGIAYPLRYLGQMKNPLMPFNIDLAPLENNTLYASRPPLSQTQRDQITRFNALMRQAVPIVFQAFRDQGYAGLTYHNTSKQDVAQPIFTADHLQYVHTGDDLEGSSDQMPFTFAGIPCATFIGNSSYYEHNPPPGSYPYDQREDTIQLMNTFANGSSQKSNALALSLALPGMLTTWMLNQAEVGGASAATGRPVAAIGNIGALQAGQSVTFDAKAAFDPQHSGATLTYDWDFGNGSRGSGNSVKTMYTSAGSYALTLTVSGSSGKISVTKELHVVTQPTQYNNPYDQFRATGSPRPNPSVVLPTPNDALVDKMLTQSQLDAALRPQPAGPTGTLQVSPLWPIIGVVLLVIVLIAGVGLLLWQRGQARKKRPVG